MHIAVATYTHIARAMPMLSYLLRLFAYFSLSNLSDSHWHRACCMPSVCWQFHHEFTFFIFKSISVSSDRKADEGKRKKERRRNTHDEHTVEKYTQTHSLASCLDRVVDYMSIYIVFRARIFSVRNVFESCNHFLCRWRTERRKQKKKKNVRWTRYDTDNDTFNFIGMVHFCCYRSAFAASTLELVRHSDCIINRIPKHINCVFHMRHSEAPTTIRDAFVF